MNTVNTFREKYPSLYREHFERYENTPPFNSAEFLNIAGTEGLNWFFRTMESPDGVQNLNELVLIWAIETEKPIEFLENIVKNFNITNEMARKKHLSIYPVRSVLISSSRYGNKETIKWCFEKFSVTKEDIVRKGSDIVSQHLLECGNLDCFVFLLKKYNIN
jgi:hypothetical protein